MTPPQARQQLVADAVPGDREIAVAAVLTVLDTLPGGVCADLGAGGAQQWTDDPGGADRGHGPQPGGSRTPEQTQEHGLGLIVGMMAEGHPPTPGPLPDPLE